MNGYSIEIWKRKPSRDMEEIKKLLLFAGSGMRIYYAFRENMIQEIWFPENSEN